MVDKSSRNASKLRKIDDTDHAILRILSKNARVKLTSLAREIRLSIDSTKKRMQKLEENKVILRYTINVDPEKLGRPLGIHVYVKFKDLVKEKYDEFIDELMKDYRVVVLMDIIGDYDLLIVFLTKGTEEMAEIKTELRQKFGSIIGDWKEVVISKVHVLEDFRF